MNSVVCVALISGLNALESFLPIGYVQYTCRKVAEGVIFEP